jgi:hypothetical protein
MMNQENFKMVRDCLSQRGKVPVHVLSSGRPTEEEIRMLFDERITPETELPPMEPLFRIFDTPCFYRGELVADCGKAKSGKTTFLSVLMAAGCLPQNLQKEVSIPLQRVRGDPLRILWIDTEQSQQSTLEILRERIPPYDPPKGGMIPHEGGKDHIYAFNLRGMGYEVRRRMVEVAVQTVRPDLAIIDGVKDLMTDINDAVQATLIMEQLMALARLRNCCIVCVLHQNKSEADRNMRGSIGTELTNKAFEVFQCEYLERHEVFRVSQTYSRRQRMRQDLCYRLSDDGRPEPCDAPQEQPRDVLGRWVSRDAGQQPVTDLRRLFSEAMEGRTQRPFSELMAVALKRCGVPDAQAYYACVREAERQGIIRKAEHPETRQAWVELCEDGMLPF